MLLSPSFRGVIVASGCLPKRNSNDLNINEEDKFQGLINELSTSLPIVTQFMMAKAGTPISMAAKLD